ncbi:MAG: 1A family penicillin-binding protein [Parcubacteria group bacterium Licking1014_17]|nr:MAG: 1A family penicillin-binding protein [Parcubacteria group bacterium Licking1014_17]
MPKSQQLMINIRKKLKKWSRFFIAAGVVFVLGVTVMVIMFLYYISQIPDPTTLSARRISESTKIYDNTGVTLLYDVHGEEKRTIVPWSDISENVKKATLTSEDSDFYNHNGIDFRGILRAFYRDITSLSVSQGGSTITQQLVKTSLLGTERTFSRKIKEAILSIQVEKNYSKDYIFWMYLNQIPYGSNAYGIEAASQTFFAKHALDITLAESALLTALIKAPSYYSPYGNHVTELMSRKDYILNRMSALNTITKQELDAALAEKLDIKPPHDSILAPHFIMMVKDLLVKKYGEDMVENGGLKVITTLDTELQSTAEELVTKYGDINEKKYKSTNAGLVAVDPRNGYVKALVGSRDYFNIEKEGNFNVVTALRQPGSSFKPFAYATAFNKGYTDSTILFDFKTEFNPNCDASGNQEYYKSEKCYHPQDYDGRFRGPVTMRQAMAQSLNVPSVMTLYLAGIDDTIRTAQRMGITTLTDRSRYGLSLVLGGAEVHLLDMASAYGVFANDGVYNPAVLIEKVTSSDGVVLEEYSKNDREVISTEVSRLVTDVLSDNNARGPVFGYNSSLYFPDRQVAAKTGTTQDNRDGWVIGYTPVLSVGVWTGNNNNEPMTKQGAGLSAAGPMWHEFMVRALKNTPSGEFIKPQLPQTEKIMLNGSYYGSEGIYNILYYVDKDNPSGSQPNSPASDPQYKNWEYPVQKWILETGQTISTPTPAPPETISPTFPPSPTPTF